MASRSRWGQFHGVIAPGINPGTMAWNYRQDTVNPGEVRASGPLHTAQSMVGLPRSNRQWGALTASLVAATAPLQSRLAGSAMSMASAASTPRYGDSVQETAQAVEAANPQQVVTTPTQSLGGAPAAPIGSYSTLPKQRATRLGAFGIKPAQVKSVVSYPPGLRK